MFNISSIYPKKDGYEFDFDYYLNRHMPRSIELLSAARGFKGVSVERGMDVDESKLESSYVAMCHYYFDSLEDFMAAFGPHAEALQGDIANYTNIEPTIQINEVQISGNASTRTALTYAIKYVGSMQDAVRFHRDELGLRLRF